MTNTGRNEVTGREGKGRRPLSTADLAEAGQPREQQVIADNEPTGTFESVRADAQDKRTDSPDKRTDAPTDAPRNMTNPAARQSEALEPLFTPDRAETYRTQWLSIQSGFVDDPRRAVKDGDELVAQVMANLANTFAEERHRMEAQLDETGEGATENLRVALRRYRSFFDRLLEL